MSSSLLTPYPRSAPPPRERAVRRGFIVAIVLVLVLALVYPLILGALVRKSNGHGPAWILVEFRSCLEETALRFPDRPLGPWSSDRGAPPWDTGFWGASQSSLKRRDLEMRVAPPVAGRSWSQIGPEETVLEYTAGRTDGLAGVRKDGQVVRETPFWSRVFGS